MLAPSVALFWPALWLTAGSEGHSSLDRWARCQPPPVPEVLCTITPLHELPDEDFCFPVKVSWDGSRGWLVLRSYAVLRRYRRVSAKPNRCCLVLWVGVLAAAGLLVWFVHQAYSAWAAAVMLSVEVRGITTAGRHAEAAAEHQGSRKDWGKVVVVFKWSLILLRNLWLNISDLWRRASVLSLGLAIHSSSPLLPRINPADFSAPWSELHASSCRQSVCERAPTPHLQAVLERKSMRLSCHLLQPPTRQASYSQAVDWSIQSRGSAHIQTRTVGQLGDTSQRGTPLWCGVTSHWISGLKCIHYFDTFLRKFLWWLWKANVAL